jgi:multicomponent Na+:H+ antiporter subunit E
MSGQLRPEPASLAELSITPLSTQMADWGLASASWTIGDVSSELRGSAGMGSSGRRVLAAAVWNLAVWVLLTWTRTVEVLSVGVVVSLVVAVALAPLGDVVPPWRLFQPRRAVGVVRLLVDGLRRVVIANVKLTRVIWSRQVAPSSGMVIVPTSERTEGGLAALGLISSLIVDNQIVDIDRRRHELQYHAITIRAGGREARYDEINGPVERLLAPIEGRSSD